MKPDGKIKVFIFQGSINLSMLYIFNVTYGRSLNEVRSSIIFFTPKILYQAIFHPGFKYYQ